MDPSLTHPREMVVPRNVIARYLDLFCGGDDKSFSSKGVERRPGHQGKPITRPQTIVGLVEMVGDVLRGKGRGGQ